MLKVQCALNTSVLTLYDWLRIRAATCVSPLVLLALPCAKKVKNVLHDKLHVVPRAAAVNAQGVRQNAHLHGAVRSAGEHVIGRGGFDLHDARAEVAEERLSGVFVVEGVQEGLCRHAPHLTD